MNAKYKLKHCCIWRPNCFVQEASGTTVAPNIFCFNKINMQDPITLLTAKCHLDALQLRQEAIQATVVVSLPDKDSPKPPLPPLYKHVQSERSDLSDWQHLYLKQQALPHGFRGTLS